MSDSQDTTTKHTPPPWVVSVYEDRTEISMGSALEGLGNSWETQHKITLDWETDDDGDEDLTAQVEEAWANINLIAAAPLLLEAAIPVAQMLADQMVSCCRMWDEGHADDCPAEALRTAIAAARGEETGGAL